MATLVRIGPAAHAEEERGLLFLERSLPEGTFIYSNVLLPTGIAGETYEYDAIVIARHAVFAVEMKAWGGKIVGNRDYWTLQSGKIVPSPIPLIERKARVLKSLALGLGADFRNVWTQGLVFVTLEDANPDISEDFAPFVTTLRTVGRALTDPQLFGRGDAISPKQAGRLARRIKDDGRTPTRDRKIGDYDLLERLPALPGPFLAWRAELRVTKQKRILHVYEIDLYDPHRAEQQRVRARKEAAIHERLAGVPEIVRCHGVFTADDPERIVVPFDDTTGLLSLATWVRKHAKAGLATRLGLAVRLARALTGVHHEGIIHRRLSPDSVLVEPVDEPGILRLTTFDLGKDLVNRTETVTVGALQDPSLRCVAPEVFKLGETTLRSDLFSLGAVFYELFTGRALFKKADEVVGPFVPGPLVLDGKELPAALKGLVSRLLRPEPVERPASAEAVLAELESLIRSLTGPPPPRALESGQILREVYELENVIGSGASGTTWRARQLRLGSTVVLKIAPPDQVVAHDTEIAALEDLRKKGVRHSSLVRLMTAESLPDGRPFLVTDFVDGVTGREQIVAGDPLTPDQLRTVAQGLYGAIGALHGAGWLHRDVKPENLVLYNGSLTPTLLDLSIAARIGEETDLLSGSPAYKDPQLWVEGRWRPEHDLFALAVVLWELLTRVHPFSGRPAERGHAPEVRADDVPSTFPETVRTALATHFLTLLSEEARDRRPRDATAALDSLLACLDAKPVGAMRPRPQPLPTFEAPLLPPDGQPGDPLATAPLLSVRVRVALHRLGARTLGDLAGLDPSALDRPGAMSRRVAEEVRPFLAAARERWPGHEPAKHEAPEPGLDTLFPALAGDDRPVVALGRDLTAAVRKHLEDLGVVTLGQLSALPVLVLASLDGIGRGKVERLRRALGRLLDPEVPATLESLAEAIEKDLKSSRYAALVELLGLADGEARTLEAAGERLGVTRQRVDQLAAEALEVLRRPGSAASPLAAAAREALGPRGFLPLEALAPLLLLRFPAGGEKTLAPIGFARLAALLLDPVRRATGLWGLTAAAASPWKLGDPEALAKALAEEVDWPPRTRGDLETLVTGLLPPDVVERLLAGGVTTADVLDGLLALAPILGSAADGTVYRKPVPLGKALDHLRVRVGLPLEKDEEGFCQEVARLLPGVELPASSAALSAALARVGLALRGGNVIDPKAALAAAPLEMPALDHDVDRQVVSTLRPGRPPVVQALVSSIRRGGFRVVALPPGQHHLLSRRLAGWLGEDLGAPVRYVDVDRVLLDALKARGLWDDALFYDGRADATWGWAEEELKAALDAAVRSGTPGSVTVVARPSLLGPLGLLPWVSGFYDAARGGRFGLVVLALPGGVKDGRVWLNNHDSIPCVPDMAPVYLEAEAEAA